MADYRKEMGMQNMDEFAESLEIALWGSPKGSWSTTIKRLLRARDREIIEACKKEIRELGDILT